MAINDQNTNIPPPYSESELNQNAPPQYTVNEPNLYVQRANNDFLPSSYQTVYNNSLLLSPQLPLEQSQLNQGFFQQVPGVNQPYIIVQPQSFPNQQLFVQAQSNDIPPQQIMNNQGNPLLVAQQPPVFNQQPSLQPYCVQQPNPQGTSFSNTNPVFPSIPISQPSREIGDSSFQPNQSSFPEDSFGSPPSYLNDSMQFQQQKPAENLQQSAEKPLQRNAADPRFNSPPVRSANVNHNVGGHQISSDVKTQKPNVPYDWEKRVTSDGKLFYLDHITKTSHWPPPPGWFAKKTDTGKLFYYHQPTKSTHWRLPPSGWSVRLSNEGKVYFLDHNSKTTHWSLPHVVPVARTAPSLGTSPPVASPPPQKKKDPKKEKKEKQDKKKKDVKMKPVDPFYDY